MNKQELYVGSRVYTRNDPPTVGIPGTIINTECRVLDNHYLVEFDENIHGHSGLGWGTVEGKYGHCFWFPSSKLEAIPTDEVYEDYGISHCDLIKGVLPE